MTDASHDGRRAAILAHRLRHDPGRRRARARPTATIDGLTTWPAGYRHGETLVPTIERFLGEQNIRRSRLTAIVVGTGPGAFTGLRVGLATAKGLAHGLRLPIVGISTAEALLAVPGLAGRPGPAAAGRPVRPDAGPARPGAELLPAGDGAGLGPARRLVAVDLDGRADPAAVALGETARAGLGDGADPARGGAAAPPATPDDLAQLVPEYVTLPRGIAAERGEVEWSRDPR